MFEESNSGSSLDWAKDESDLYKILRRVRTEKESFKNTLRTILTEDEKRERLFEENLEMFYNNVEDIVISKACGDRFDVVINAKYHAYNSSKSNYPRFNLQENMMESEFDAFQRFLDLLVIFIENEVHKYKLKTFDELQDSVMTIVRLVESLQNIGVEIDQIRFEL